ncbi:hypothetical protein GO730_31115 [Spirosoma sp. HMF3257]|uniref:hypothetical protein n=1 Tax=Spirosoma telluris TaxID=2183553 RepID=UPI0011B94878|nr:hypothetical protein [Spirosoma telluris]
MNDTAEAVAYPRYKSGRTYGASHPKKGLHWTNRQKQWLSWEEGGLSGCMLVTIPVRQPHHEAYIWIFIGQGC